MDRPPCIPENDTGRAINSATDLLSKPGKVTSFATALGKLATMTADPRTPFKGELTREKRAVWSKPIDLGMVKAIRKYTGATVNDVLLAAVSGALGRYLVSHGTAVEGLDIRAVVPVNLRSLEEAHELGNRFGLVFLPLPLGIEDSLLLPPAWLLIVLLTGLAGWRTNWRFALFLLIMALMLWDGYVMLLGDGFAELRLQVFDTFFGSGQPL